MSASRSSLMEDSSLSGRVDHLVYAAQDLEASIDELEEVLGVRAAMGGRHPGRGTRNALLALSDSCYLEIIAPDPEQTREDVAPWFGVDTLHTPRLVAWAAKGTDLERLVAMASERGVDLGPVLVGSRQRPDGATLRWRLTDPAVVSGGGLVPFFIDWGESPHPAASAPRGPLLIALRGQHPDPVRVRATLSVVGLELPVEVGPEPGLIATLRGAEGEVELR